MAMKMLLVSALFGLLVPALVSSETDDTKLFKCGAEAPKKLDELDDLFDSMWKKATGKEECAHDVPGMKKACEEKKVFGEKMTAFTEACTDGLGKQALTAIRAGSKKNHDLHCKDDKTMEEFLLKMKCVKEHKAGLAKCVEKVEATLLAVSEEEDAAKRNSVMCNNVDALKVCIHDEIAPCPEDTKKLMVEMCDNKNKEWMALLCGAKTGDEKTTAKPHSKKQKTPIVSFVRFFQKASAPKA